MDEGARRGGNQIDKRNDFSCLFSLRDGDGLHDAHPRYEIININVVKEKFFTHFRLDVG